MGVNLYVNLDTLQLVDGPGGRNPITALRFKRGDAAKLDVVFFQGGTSAASIGDPLTLELQFGVKQRNRYDAGYLVHTSAWTLPNPDATAPVYQCSPSFNTVELDGEFGGESSTGTELAEVTLMGEITWREGAGDPTSTRTFLVVVENDVNRGTEGVPLTAEPAYPAPTNIVTMSTLGNHAVRFDMVQNLTTEQKAQARANIGVEEPQAPLPVDAASVTTSIQGMSAEQVAAVALALGIPEEAVVDAASVAAAIDAMDAAQVAALQAKLEIPAGAGESPTPENVSAAIVGMSGQTLEDAKGVLGVTQLAADLAALPPPTEVTSAAVAGAITTMVDPELSGVKAALGVGAGGSGIPSDVYYVKNGVMGTGVKGDPSQPFASINEVLTAEYNACVAADPNIDPTAVAVDICLIPNPNPEFPLSFGSVPTGASGLDVHIVFTSTQSSIFTDQGFYVNPTVMASGTSPNWFTLWSRAPKLGISVAITDALNLTLYDFDSANADLQAAPIGDVGIGLYGVKSFSSYASFSLVASTGNLSVWGANCGGSGGGGVNLAGLLTDNTSVSVFASVQVDLSLCDMIFPFALPTNATINFRNCVMEGGVMDFSGSTTDNCSFTA